MGESVSLLCEFGGNRLHTNSKRHEFFSSTHQALRKDNNNNHRILSLERSPKSSNLKGCNQGILEVNQCSYKIGTSISASGSFALDWRDAIDHYLARMCNLCLDILLQQQELSHHGYAHPRLHIFLGTIEINSVFLAINWYLKRKVPLILKHGSW